jgi:hypothetical protein
MRIPSDLPTKSRSLQTLFSWLSFLLFSEHACKPLKAVVMMGDDAAWHGLAIMAVTALPSLALLAVLWSARTMFKAMAASDMLSAGSSSALTRVGDWLIGSAILGFAVGPFEDTLDALGTTYFSTLVLLAAIGLAIRLLGRIHALAAAIAADNSQII